jgi:hypothetical protein
MADKSDVPEPLDLEELAQSIIAEVDVFAGEVKEFLKHHADLSPALAVDLYEKTVRKSKGFMHLGYTVPEHPFGEVVTVDYFINEMLSEKGIESSSNHQINEKLIQKIHGILEKHGPCRESTPRQKLYENGNGTYGLHTCYYGSTETFQAIFFKKV